MCYFAAHCICILHQAKHTVTSTAEGFGSPRLSPFVQPKKMSAGDSALTCNATSVVTL